MKFPSLVQLWQSLLVVCKRFTPSIAYTLLATVAALALSFDWDNVSTATILTKFIYLGNFGLVLSLAFALYSEVYALTKLKKRIGNLCIFLILALLYFLLTPNVYNADIFVLICLGFSFHVLVAFSAFFSPDLETGFWQLNKAFFLRFATSALYSAVLFAGLSIALLSIDTLFNVHWHSKVYIRLWIFIVGIFNTIFFLAGVPHPLITLNTTNAYPKPLKVFTQYVLIPLASIYLLILLAYETKIILAWSLPNSSVAILVLGYAVFGILSLLLVHPIRNQEENKWIKFYSRWFYLLMVPLLFLLAVAIIKRVSDYGVTESRYLLIVLSLWLSFITAYFLIKGKKENIRMIPISLFAFAVLISFGPWGIKNVSRNSQSERLASFIAQKPSTNRDKEIRSMVKYLAQNHGGKSLQKFVKINLEAIEAKQLKTDNNWGLRTKLADTVLLSLNVSKTENVQETRPLQKNYVNAQQGDIDVEKALKLIVIKSNNYTDLDKKTTFSLGDATLSVFVNDKHNLILSSADGSEITFNVTAILKTLNTNKKLSTNDTKFNSLLVQNNNLSITHPFKNYKFTFRIEELNAFYPKENSLQVENVYYTGYLIVYPNL